MNAQSVMNKLCELKVLLDSESPDICGITESGIAVSISDAETAIPGYSLYRKAHSSGGGGPGKGVAIYISDRLKHSLCQEMEDYEGSKKLDCTLWVRVKTAPDGSNLTIGTVYRSPNATDETNNLIVESLIKSEGLNDKHIFIMGDFNLPKIKWSTGEVDDADLSYSVNFIESIESLGWCQHVTEETRFRSRNIPSILDLLFTREADVIEDLAALPPIGKSDHVVLKCSLPVDKLSYKNTSRKIFRFKNANWAKIKEDLLAADWDLLLSDTACNDYTRFVSILSDLKDKYVPVATFRVTPNPPWTKKKRVKVAIREKWSTFKKYRKTRSLSDHSAYILARNNVKTIIKDEKNKYDKMIVEDKNPKRLQAYCRRKFKSEKGIGNLKKADGEETASDTEAAEVMNAYFQSVFTRDDGNAILEHSPYPHAGRFEDFTFTPDDVEEVLDKITISKAAGPDGLDAILFKRCAEQLKYPLYLIFRKSLDTGIVPKLWRESEIAPIHKKGPNNRAENYRPVNLTQIACKSFETLFKISLTTYLATSNLFSTEQHGFLKGRSCQSNILECKEQWTRALDEDDWLDIVYFDYKTAFDSVNHRLLLEKLKWFGIGGKALNWMKSFLGDRHQRVKIGNARSEWRSVLSGTGQGSVIGVILFILYINDLPKSCLSQSSISALTDPKVKLLADDTKAYKRISKNQPTIDSNVLQGVIDSIYQWSLKWQMTIHPAKTKVLHIGKDNPRNVYNINGININSTETEKDIGFFMNENLSSSHHVCNARARALGEIATIRRSFDHIDEKLFTMLYNQKIRPHIEWGSTACPPDSRAEANSLDRVQSKATHLVKSLRQLSSEERRRRLKLFPLSYRRLRGDLLEVFKIIKGLTRLDYRQFWEVKESRNGPTLVKEQVGPNRPGGGRKQRTSFFSYRVIKPWNWLPKTLKVSQTLDSFKRGLDALMETENWNNFIQQL